MKSIRFLLLLSSAFVIASAGAMEKAEVITGVIPAATVAKLEEAAQSEAVKTAASRLAIVKAKLATAYEGIKANAITAKNSIQANAVKAKTGLVAAVKNNPKTAIAIAAVAVVATGYYAYTKGYINKAYAKLVATKNAVKARFC